jgi:hypothetical protein
MLRTLRFCSIPLAAILLYGAANPASAAADPAWKDKSISQ